MDCYIYIYIYMYIYRIEAGWTWLILCVFQPSSYWCQVFQLRFRYNNGGPCKVRWQGCHPHKVLSFLDDLPIFHFLFYKFSAAIFDNQLASPIIVDLSVGSEKNRKESSEACDFEDVEGAAPEHFRLWKGGWNMSSWRSGRLFTFLLNGWWL